jgi:hypothetical protein
MRRPPAPLLFALFCACATAPEPEEPQAASRDDVRQALYRQFDLVLARRREIGHEEGEAAVREREELDRLADEIAMQIVRLDPDADVDVVLRELERSR